jgi:uncharacterized protein YjbJ (UPF0337 family)
MTDDEVEQVGGNAEKLTGLVQERYGSHATRRSAKSIGGCRTASSANFNST